ncbi:MAG TPA: amino acid synthesis family protein [Pseudolabrys sp.]|nr:amino acid synthesis family protein [Pseudolabrys sp.]
MEGGRRAERPGMMAAAAAVIANPWAGRGFVEDLRPEILGYAPALGDLLVPMLLQLLGGGDKVEAYGKAAVCGVNGEVEHASGFIHTLRFGNKFRQAVGGKSYLSFTNRRGGPGSSIQIPMMHKLDEGLRSHYLTLEFAIADAPGPDEIVVAIGGATAGRAHPRIGNRYLDMEEMARETVKVG